MASYKDTTYFLAAVLPGEQHELGPRLIPMVDGSGFPIPEAGDGDKPLRMGARRFLRNIGVVPKGASMRQLAEAIQAPSLEYADSDYDLVVTDSRVVIVGREVQADLKRVVGQIRFPWIVSVQFRPKQSFWNDAELIIKTFEKYDRDGFPVRETGRFEHSFTFVFHKKIHPGEFAAEIVRRASNYVAAQPGCPVEPELLTLQQAEVLPDPAKGQYAEYWAKVFCTVPDGHYGTDDSTRAPDWTVANI